MKKMDKKVLIVGPTPPPFHGVSFFTENLLTSELVKRFKVFHLDTSDRRRKPNMGRLDPTNMFLGFKHLFLIFYYNLVYHPSAVYIPISQNKLGFLRDGLFVLISAIFGSAVVIHLHGGIFDRFYNSTDPVTRFFICFVFKFVDRAIVLCNALSNIFGDLLPKNKVRVVHNGVKESISDEEFLTALRKKMSDNRREFLVGFMGTLDKNKGFIDFIKSLPYVLTKFKNVKFSIAGKWHKKEDKEESLDFLRNNNLEEFVQFMGVVRGEEKKKYLLESDIFVFPTKYYYEGQPIVVIEAMMAGLPVIVTPRACLKEMIEDSKNGYIVPENSPERIGEGIIKLLENRKEWERISLNNRKKFECEYRWEICVNSIEEILKEV